MSTREKYIVNFIRESNKIEGIMRQPRRWEIDAMKAFLELDFLTVADIQNIVNAFQQGAELREHYGMNVWIGGKEKLGGPEIRPALEDILNRANAYKTNRRSYRGSLEKFEIARAEHVHPWQVHCSYEYLHPFMDGNGRSGRAIWAWMHGGQSTEFIRGFLHSFYYETLMNN
jgi:hypothetical protein